MEGADYFVEGLLDFTNGGDDMITDAFFHSTDGNSSHTPLSDSCNSSGSGSGSGLGSASRPSSFPDSHFSNDLCVPCDELEELEWLSNFVEESFSTEELHKFHLIPSQPSPIQYPIRQLNPNPNPNPNPTQQNPSTVPGKARSKRSRVPPCDWSTRLLMVSNQNPSPATSSSSGQSPTSGPRKPVKKRESGGVGDDNDGLEVRRCLHCAAEKTPQWRTGPMGPKTLCNACGVRYKSGRLVPEYRPAASPTFVSARHSNSHRKVMELRRQKEVQRPQPPQFLHQQLHHHHQPQHQHHHSMMMGVSNNGDEYMNYHHMAPDYRQMMS
ncbi:GATA transcription factor 12-like [Silene latifolia]|uniref:GATA transcription factor 12-like n=1 Tax=Silene latifolia TaxID=37657 RepID=UPI003D782F8C